MHSSISPSLLNALDRSIDGLAEESFGFLQRLIAAPSTVGQEAAAQRVVQAELDRLGFVTSAIDVPEDIAADPAAGVPQAPYVGRPNVVGHLTAGAGPSLLLNGHIDAAPAEPGLWLTPPFQPVRRDGWLFGRGAGDMKGGFAVAALAVAALHAAYLAGCAAGELRVGDRGGVHRQRSWPPRGTACWPTRWRCSNRPTWACCSAGWASCGPS